MDLGLSEKVVVVAGSSRGIGKAIAHRFLQEGARALISGRNKKRLQQTLEEFISQFSEEKVISYCGDLLKLQDIRACLDTVLSAWSRIDVVVANIGSGQGVPLESCDEHEWQRVFQINLFSAMDLVLEVLPVMKAQKAGAICLIASIAGMEALRAPIPYTAAKAGVIAAGKSLSRYLAEFNIRVNVIAPGNILFPDGSWDKKLKSHPEEILSYIDEEVPLKRFGSPDEVAACVVFICSPHVSFVTGACLAVDGGQTHAM